MLHKEFFGLIFLGFVFWIISATSPNDRIAHACRPIGWSGNVITSVSALALPSQQGTVQEWFDRLEYGCQYTTWRLFYQDEYNKWKASPSKQVGPLQKQDATATTPAPAASDAAAPSKTGPAVPAESKATP